MKAIYIGFLVKESDFLNQKGYSSAGNKTQLNMLDQLIKLDFDTFDIVTIIPTAPYPSVNKIFFKSYVYSINETIKTKVISFVNIPILKQISQMFSVTIQIIRLLFLKTNSDEIVIYTYNYNIIVSLPLILLRFFFTFKSICFLYDPFYIHKSISLTHHFKNLYYHFSNVILKKYDGVIAVNKNSIEKFHPSSHSLVVEGGINGNEIQFGNDFLQNEFFNITFAGSLYEYNGIKIIIEMLKYLNNENIILNIYGDGPLKDVLINYSKIDPRLKYHGLVPNEEVVIQLRKSDLLLNIRLVDDEISKYTFPSKLLEYLTTGIPVLSSRINGMPYEYENVLFFLENQSPEDLALCITNIMNLEKNKLIDIGKKGKDLVMSQKTWSIQMKRVFEFSKGLFNGN